MGVQGITKLLLQKGILSSPSRGCCTTELWKNKNDSSNDSDNVEHASVRTILRGSTLLLDGPGLAFHLHSIAYNRWARKVTNRQPSDKSCRDTAKLTASQITLLLPHNMPLQLLVELTTELVTYLRDTQGMQLQVYWDGPTTTSTAMIPDFKAATIKKRRERRELEWSNLQRYCHHGIVPTGSNSFSCQIGDEFPMAGMFLMIVRQTLQELNIPNIVCDGEADSAMAQQACDRDDIYVVGQDSDFFFYRGMQYIPFDGFFSSLEEKDQTQPILKAHVYTRREIAQSLGLEDGHMTELAVMLGNDYVDAMATFQSFDRDHDKILVFLAGQDEEEYQHTSSNANVEAAIQYSRVLYNHGSMEDLYTGDDNLPEEDDNDTTEDDDETKVELGLSKQSKSLLQYARVEPGDASVREAWLRSLQLIADQTMGEEHNRVLDTQHLKVLQQHQSISPSPRSLQSDLLELPRPKWEDMLAATLIEMCALKLLKGNAASGPIHLFDHAIFHHGMSTIRSTVDLSADEKTENDDSNVQLPMTEESPETPTSLPIDDHRDTILESIRNNRVSIIHGETGCGKSSRVPIMLLEARPPDPALSEIKIFISQPRRIAAKALVERVRSCEPKHGHKFALRLGHGHREYHSAATQAYFVTTGYLTRLLANHPEKFDECTHLVIDEVHERSVDTDLLCYLCRRLLVENKHIRLVLMSATLATKLYQDYFNVPNDPIHVGVRRHPIQEVYLEDLNRLQLSAKERQAVAALSKECETKKCKSAPGVDGMKKLTMLAARLPTIVGEPGSSVLVFVPGMAEIISITEQIESTLVAGVRYTCFPIHSDIPFEDQMAAFDSPDADEVKIIIATNAAESSVTLPDVDHVICLGLCRQIVYNAASHRQMLTPTWISRASAKQRAGRTGRVRPGTVYRLYTKAAYENHMLEFEPGEMVRIPLDSVILMLKEMLHENVTPVLLDCIEPPNTSTIDRSFESLHQWHFLSRADDDGEITVLGSFVGSLGMDLMFGSLIGLGIQFGVGPEMIELASVMSFPRTPFQITSPLIHSPAEFNEISKITFVSRCHFDANSYSEPLGLLNLMWDYERAKNKGHFCSHYRVAVNRFRQLVASKNNKRKRVAEFLGIDENHLRMECPPVHMPPSKLAIIRILQVWVFSEMMIEAKPVPINAAPDGTVTLKITTTNKGRPLSSEDLDQVLDKDRHPFRIVLAQKISQKGSFEPLKPFNFGSFLPVFEERLLSYICVNDIDLAWCFDSSQLFVYIPDCLTTNEGFMDLVSVVVEGEKWTTILAEEQQETGKRGISERTCGAWVVKQAPNNAPRKKGNQQGVKVFRRYALRLCGSLSLGHILGEIPLASRFVRSTMEWDFSSRKKGGKKKGKKKTETTPHFSANLNGSINEINKLDLHDLLGTSTVAYTSSRKGNSQTIVFDAAANSPCAFRESEDKQLATCSNKEGSSWKNTLLPDIPEAVRLLSVIGSGQRKSGHKIILQSKGNEGEEAEEFDLNLGKETRITHRWKRLSLGGAVYVPEYSVPASATSPLYHLFACCANALEVPGASVYADPYAQMSTYDNSERSEYYSASSDDDDESMDMSGLIKWIRARYPSVNDTVKFGSLSENRIKFDKQFATTKIKQALSFHRSCATLGETLVCIPEVVGELCGLFDGLGGQDMSLWDTIHESSLTAENLGRWRIGKQTTFSSKPLQPKQSKQGEDITIDVNGTPTTSTKKKKTKQKGGNKSKQAVQPKPATRELDDTDTSNIKKEPSGKKSATKNKQNKPGTGDTKKTTLEPVSTLTDKKKALGIRVELSRAVTQDFNELFATKMPDAAKVPLNRLASTNILALLLESCFLAEGAQKPAKKQKRIDWTNWDLFKLNHDSGETIYRACFKCKSVPFMPIEGRGKNLLPKWMRKHPRPFRTNDAATCIPEVTRSPSLESYQIQSPVQTMVWFQSIDAALRMEAAFWLERQFCRAAKSGKTVTFRHWYDHTFEEMTEVIREQKSQL